MRTCIVVHPSFDLFLPFTADRLYELLAPVADVSLVRLADGETIAGSPIPSPETVRRLIALGVSLDEADLKSLPELSEAMVSNGYEYDSAAELLDRHGVRQLRQLSEGFWAQSVSEFALGLTIGALRRIPQTHHEIIMSQAPWHYPRIQYGDDSRFANGTVEGKRVRIVGAGNIASRYASFMSMLGADVAAWDPFAAEPAFHRAGARREHHLDRLIEDAEIFAPMVPLLPSTQGLVSAAQIAALPTGALVVLATRAGIVDVPELRRRVLADELSLAADVFDIEPLPLDDPLLGRHNVVHTPHNAGRTKETNFLWALMLAEQFPEFDRSLVAPPPPVV